MANRNFDAFQGLIIVFVIILLVSWGDLSFAEETKNISIFGRKSFPPHFIFGAASSAYQYEGAAFEDGRGPSIWDTFSRNYPNKITDRTTGDVADDFYHRYKDDIKIMKSLGLDGFRLSISWSRVIPSGKLSKGVNKAGIAFYNNLINQLLANGITPFVTIFHWDTPQGLEDEYGGFLSPRIAKDFVDFAELCFKEFGDRVKRWATFNEPWSFSYGGYDIGVLAPGRCSAWRNSDCAAGNSGVEPYLVAHHILISHAAASKLYREKYKPTQKGEIGIVLVSHWFVPFSRSQANIEAAQRAVDFMYGWFMDPLVFGDYPKIMRNLVGKRLPKFSEEETKLVKGSFDFLGVNYYTAYFAINTHFPVGPNISYTTDSRVNQTGLRNGRPIGEPEDVATFYVYPRGLRELLVYTKNKYHNPPVYVTENGLGQTNLDTVKKGVRDLQRVRFYQGHLKALKEAIDLGADVKGYFPWSFLDTWEWGSGFTQRFGLVFVDFKNGLKRYPKLSAQYYKKFLSS